MNTEQLAAAHDPAQDVCVVAGPGSGKSTTMIEAIHRDIENRGDGADIVALSFTQSAARVLRSRLNREICFTGTIHGFCMRTLRRYYPWITLIDEQAAERLLKKTADQLGYKGSNIALAEARKNFWSKKQQLGTYSPAERVVLAYASQLAKECLVEYDMLLARTLHLIKCKSLNDFPSVRFYVDEFQDCANIDIAILNAYPHSRLFAVGDIDQCLYEFRDANPRNMLAFYEKASRHTLSSNYRSSPDIVYSANKLIGHNKMRVPVDMVAMKPISHINPSPSATIVADATAHDMEVANLVSQYISRGVALQEIAVLCRTNEQVREMVAWLNSRGIVTASRQVSEIPDLSRVRTLVGLALNPNSQVLRDIEQDQRRSRVPLHIPIDLNKLFKLVAWVKENHACSDAMGLLLHQAMADCAEEAPNRLLDFLRENQGNPERPRDPERTPGVQVGTMNWSKGQEFEVVIIAHADQPVGGPAIDEAERRLYYVALTRAKSAVVAVGARRRYVQFHGWMDRCFVSCVEEANMLIYQ